MGLSEKVHGSTICSIALRVNLAANRELPDLVQHLLSTLCSARREVVIASYKA